MAINLYALFLRLRTKSTSPINEAPISKNLAVYRNRGTLKAGYVAYNENKLYRNVHFIHLIKPLSRIAAEQKLRAHH